MIDTCSTPGCPHVPRTGHTICHVCDPLPALHVDDIRAGSSHKPPLRRETDAVQSNFEKDLINILDELKSMLLAKNRKYGDAALNPNQTFSRSSPVELINVRIDDKLSRIKNRQNDEDEDPIRDLLGYLVLHQIATRRQKIVELGSPESFNGAVRQAD